jgi:hypothetical protein
MSVQTLFHFDSDSPSPEWARGIDIAAIPSLGFDPSVMLANRSDFDNLNRYTNGYF